MKKIESNRNTSWEYELNSEKELLHHDFEVLPNGNILSMVWERIDDDEYNNLAIVEQARLL